MSIYFKKRLYFILPEGLNKSWCPLSLTGYCMLYENVRESWKKER